MTTAMDDHLLRFRGSGPEQRGAVHYGPFLRAVLDALVDGCQQATRLRIEGRSSAQGTPPAWLEEAAAFNVRELGPAELVLAAPPIGAKVPSTLLPHPAAREGELFRRSGLDLLEDSLEHAMRGIADSERYDRKLIETLESFGRLLQYDVEAIELVNGRTLRIDEGSVRAIRELRARIPEDKRMSLTGTLEASGHGERRFLLVLDSGERTQGIAASAEALAADLASLAGKRVVVTGVARFRPSGALLRVEAERIAEAEDIDAEIRRLVEQGAVQQAREQVQAEIEAGRGNAVQVWARLLAPPVVMPGRAATGREDSRLNQAWLAEHEAEYAGEWVALRDGQRIDSDRSFKALQQRLRARKQEGVLLTKCGGAGDTKTGT